MLAAPGGSQLEYAPLDSGAYSHRIFTSARDVAFVQEGQEPLRESEICNIANLRPTSVVALFAMIDKVSDTVQRRESRECLHRRCHYCPSRH